jgi:cell division protein ZapA
MINSGPIRFRILGKEYNIICPIDERDDLLAASTYLNNKIQEIKKTGKINGSERIVIMAALDLAHELLQHKQQNLLNNSNNIKQLEDKLDNALVKFTDVVN